MLSKPVRRADSNHYGNNPELPVSSPHMQDAVQITNNLHAAIITLKASG